MGVSFFMYVSTVMIVFERSKTEPVSPREWRTVASFMEKRARTTGVNGGSSLGCMKEDSLMNCTSSVGRNTKPRVTARIEKGERWWLQKQASGGLVRN